jgi:hypothetical protein
MRSRLAGKCAICGQSFPVGTEIHWTRDDGASHQACWDKQQEPLPFDSAEADELADRLGFKRVGPNSSTE